MALIQEVESGDRRRGLEALRSVLVRAIAAGPEPRDLAALSRRLEVVMAELDALGAGKEASKADELRARRADREAADRSDPAVGQD